MPEPAVLPDVLRRRLSPTEQNLLRLAATGMEPWELARDIDGLKTAEQAKEMLGRTKEKAAQMLAEERSRRNGAATAVLDRPDAGSEEDEATTEDDAGAGGSAVADPPPPAPASPRSFDEPEREPARPPTMPKRNPGELRATLLRIVSEDGPIRQADVRDRLGIGAPQMAGLVRANSDRIAAGDLVDRSPLLSLREEPPADEACGCGVAHEPAVEPEPAPAREVVEEPLPAPPPPFAGVELPEPQAMYFEYMRALLARAREPDAPQWVFEHVERGLFHGPPR